MQIEVKGRNLQVTDEMREYVARRFDKIGKQVSELAVLELEVSDEHVPGVPVAAVALLQLKGVQLRSKEVSKDAKHAINLVGDNMARIRDRMADDRDLGTAGGDGEGHDGAHTSVLRPVAGSP